MRHLPLLFVLLLLGPLTSVLGQVYQSTDEQGNVYFSDQKTPDSEEIVVPETNVGDSVEVPPPAPEPLPEIVVEEAPEGPQGEIFVKEKDSSRRHRRHPRPEPHDSRTR